MDSYAFVVETEPGVRDIKDLQHHLYEHNAQQTGFRDGKRLAIFLRMPPGRWWPVYMGGHGRGVSGSAIFGFAKTIAVEAGVASSLRRLRMRRVRAAACGLF